jgi:hypothetical protein
MVKYYYDFNSLYPSILAYNPVPIGNPIWFEGEVYKFIPDAFGFFNTKPFIINEKGEIIK